MKQRIFWDTNIVIDLLAERHPFFETAAKIMTLAESDHFTLVVSPLSFANAYYVLVKTYGDVVARKKLSQLKAISKIADFGEAIIRKGLVYPFKDFEDGLQYLSAEAENCTLIITRDKKDFKNSALPVMTAEEFLHHFLAPK